MKDTTQFISMDFFKKFAYENRYIIAFSFLLAVISYGYELFNFTLSIDEEVDSFTTATNSVIFIGIGRWGLYFLNLIFKPFSVLPYFPSLIALFCIAMTSVLFIANEKGNLSGKLIFSTIFITHPIHSYYLAFNTTSMYYTMGMVVATLAFLMLKKTIDNGNKMKYYILPILLFSFALSCYQALLSLFLVFVVYHLFVSQFHSSTFFPKRTIILVLKWGAVCLLAMIVYKIGDLTTRYFLLGPLEEGQSEYLDQFISWGKLPLFEIIKSLMAVSVHYFLGHLAPQGMSSILVIIYLPISLFFVVKLKTTIKTRLALIVLLIILVFSPFAVVYLNGTPLPLRTLMSLPLMTGMLGFFVFSQSGKRLRKLMLFIIFALLINNTYINTRLFYSSYVSWQADKVMAIRIAERIYDFDPPKKNGRIHVVLVGSFVHQSNNLFYKSDVHGASFFQWDHGSPYRVESFFKTLGMNEFKFVLPQRMSGFEEKIKQMPSWPEKGSVDVFEGQIVLKLSSNYKTDTF